jgi:outer membrane protein TolC
MQRLVALVLALAAGPVASLAHAAQPVAPATPPAPARISLAEATRSALEKNNGLAVERENLFQADESITGAKGAYDLFLAADGNYREHTDPINSVFSGAPEGELAPTMTEANVAARLEQLLPTGGQVALWTGWRRDTTNAVFTILSPAYATLAGISVRQPLLRYLAIDPAREAVRIAVAQRGETEAQLRAAVSDTVTRVDAVYWTLVAARRNVASIEDSVGLADQQLSETKTRVEAGVLGETDIAQPTAERERRVGNLALARQIVERTQTDLKQLILADPADPLWAAELIPTDDPDSAVETPDLQAALDSARAKRPELVAAEARQEVSEIVVAARKSDVLPRLDFVGSYARNGLAGSANPDAENFNGGPIVVPPPLLGGTGRSYGTIGEDRFPDYTVGLSFSLPIQNRTARANLAIAKSQLQQSTVSLNATGQQVEGEVRNAVSAVEAQMQRIVAARSGLKAAEVQLFAEQERFAVGLSTNFLVLTRQNELTVARVTETDALTDYRRAATELARATGVLLDQRNIAVAASGDGGAPQR